MAHPRVLAALAVLSGLLVLLGVVLALPTQQHAASPSDIVTDYFAAVARGDAADALGYGDVPDAPNQLLTQKVLREQLRIAPLQAVQVGAVTGTDDAARVAVRYTLAYDGAPQNVAEDVALHRDGDTWRLDHAAIATTLHLQQAAQRATVLGAAVPTDQVLLFPGALPIDFDTKYLALDPKQSHVGFDTAAAYDVGVRVSARGRTAVAAAVTEALNACVKDPKIDLACPLPTRSAVPGTLRGRVTSDIARAVHIDLADDPAGVIKVSGTADVNGHHDALQFDNFPEPHTGSVTVPLAATLYAVAPLRLVWGSLR